MKRMLALTLAVALIAAVLWVVNPFTPVYAGEYRNGFMLTPVHQDATGIYTDTGFILKTEKDFTLEQMKEMLRLTGDNPLQITENEQKDFVITPEKELEANSLYTFVITTPSDETISWTFQTRREFAILGTLPANQSSYVPVNSGIEIYFSHTDFEDLDNYFEISPQVKGRFERNGHAAVFIPEKLEAATVYTVTIKQGLALSGTEQKLTEEVVFAFETEPEQSGKTEQKGTLYFSSLMMEFATKAAPVIPLQVYAADRQETEAVVKTTVYKYKNAQAFIDALKSRYEQPAWAYVIQEKHLMSTEGLANVASFEQTFDLTQWQQRYLTLPDALDNGFYLVESTYDGLTAQMLVQSTNLAAYYTSSDTQNLFWVNDLKNGKPVSDARVYDASQRKSYTTDARGITSFAAVQHITDDGKFELEYYIIRNTTDELVVINNRYRTYQDTSYAYDDYWRYFQTDRNLYKPDDLVAFWGYLENRQSGTNPESITVEIAEGSYWRIAEARFLSFFLPSIQKPLVTVTLPADHGFFEGNFQLPELSPGNYQITIKAGDKIVNSHYIQVENYVKPAYRMSIEKDRNAIFLGETVNFTITPAFFDGTPLPSLDVSWNMGGHPFTNTSNTNRTNPEGGLTVPFKAVTDDNTAQGEQYVYFNANASLPESGSIYSHDSVRVFINDIHAAFEASTDEYGRTTLKAKLNKIDLSRINAPDNTDFNDFLGDPAAYTKLAGSIVYHYYEKIEDGEEYDYINKTVIKKYRYEEREEIVDSFSFTTDKEGVATEIFKLKAPNEGWYTADLVWSDGNNRTMNRKVYLSNRHVKRPDAEYDWFHLESDKEKYRLDEEVTVTLKNNDDIVDDPNAVLFLEAQKGITNCTVQDISEYKTKFSQDNVPNFYISAVYFDGKGYTSAGTENIVYDTDDVKLDIHMETDKEAYRPGDTVNVKITAIDEEGKPVSARVNMALLDEAMLEISHYDVDVLGTLYQWLDAGLGYAYGTHGSGSSSGGRVVFGGIAGMDNGKMLKMDDSFSEAAPTAGSGNMADVQVRSDFRDTALFRMVKLDDNGTGTISFKLPDNVTSWVVTLAGISPDLYGGTGEASLKVTLPFFINDSMNSTYLTTDYPYVGVTAYGNDLKEGEEVTWQITSPQMPDYIQTLNGKAFERTNIPLWQLEEGVYELEIKAISKNGLSDGIKRTIYVTDTYQEIEKAVTDELKENMKLTGGKDGLTALLFTDKGRGSLIPALYSLMYSGGSRLDQQYAAYQAKLLLDEIAPDRNHYHEISTVDLNQYQKPDGGYGILPWSESDVELSALLASMLKDESGSAMLKQYFYSLIFAEPGRVNAPALFGLAVMNEPVLVDLNKAMQVQNLSTRDNIFLALAFETLGETTIAQRIYDDRVTPLLENKKPYIRVKNSDDTDTILKDTALAAVLTSRLNDDDKEGLFQYTTDNYSKKVLVNAEKLLVIMEAYQKLSDASVEFTYEYDGKTYTESLKDGRSVSVTVPSTRLGDLKITKVFGEASVVQVFSAPLTEQIEPDANLKVKRTYYDYKTGKEATSFQQNDIVKVVLEWDIAPTAMDSHYEITDYAPSGLKPIENPYQAGIRPEKGIWWWFRNTDGQKVTFNVYRDAKEKEPLVYYARVVSPGTFKADSTIIQGTLVKDSMKQGEEGTIKIAD